MVKLLKQHKSKSSAFWHLLTTSELYKNIVDMCLEDKTQIKKVPRGGGNDMDIKQKRRATIFTVAVNNHSKAVKQLTEIGANATKVIDTCGGFEPPRAWVKAALEQGYKVDNGAIVSQTQAPRFYHEMKSGTDRESSQGFMELCDFVMSRVIQDWSCILNHMVEPEQSRLFYSLQDAYLLSTAITAVEGK